MELSEGQEGTGWRKLVDRIHLLAWVFDIGGGIVVLVAVYLFGGVPSWLNLPSEAWRLVLASVAAAFFVGAASVYRWVTRKRGTLISGQLAMGLLRGWPDDKPAKSARPHKVLIVSDDSDEKVRKESADALRDFNGPRLEAAVFDPAPPDDPKKNNAPKKDNDPKKNKDKHWQDASANVSAFYVLRTRRMVKEEKGNWIYPAILKLSKTRNVHSPVVEADMCPDEPDTPIFFRISKDLFSKRVHVLLFRAIERASLMSLQAAFNRFVLFLFVVGVITVLLASRLPFFFRPAASADEMTHLTDLVKSQHTERNLLEECFPLGAEQSANPNCFGSPEQFNGISRDMKMRVPKEEMDKMRSILGSRINEAAKKISEVTKTSVNLELMHVSLATHLPSKPRLTVWRRTEYQGHTIIFVAGKSEDPGVYVFVNDPPSDRTYPIIGGALLISGWVLWRNKCAGEPDAAWDADGRVVGHCNKDGVIETADGSRFKFQPVPQPNVPFAALLCYGNAYGDGACMGVTDKAELLEDESSRQQVALCTSLIASRPTSFLFGEDVRKQADVLLGRLPGR